MKAFCSTYQIQLLQGAARTPTTQGLVEQVKLYIQKKKRHLMMCTFGLQISTWCKYAMQATYIMNITCHRAVNMTPYEAVSHMKANSAPSRLVTSCFYRQSFRPLYEGKGQKITIFNCEYLRDAWFN